MRVVFPVCEVTGLCRSEWRVFCLPLPKHKHLLEWLCLFVCRQHNILDLFNLPPLLLSHSNKCSGWLTGWPDSPNNETKNKEAWPGPASYLTARYGVLGTRRPRAPSLLTAMLGCVSVFQPPPQFGTYLVKKNIGQPLLVKNRQMLTGYCSVLDATRPIASSRIVLWLCYLSGFA